MVLIIVLSRDIDAIRLAYPFYFYISVPIVMCEMVEMTVGRGLLRVAGTAVGGTLGFLVMLRAGLASNPYLVMVMVVAISFAFGLAGRTQFLCALFLIAL
jgi:uncharacterized membrane protein YccC